MTEKNDNDTAMITRKQLVEKVDTMIAEIRKGIINTMFRRVGFIKSMHWNLNFLEMMKNEL